MSDEADDLTAMAGRYSRRAGLSGLYEPLRPDVMFARQERQRKIARFMSAHAMRPMSDADVLEVGCGQGDNLLELLQLGARPGRLQGAELLPDRVVAARARLPASVRIWPGDATDAPVPPASQDLVLAATVFSSILDDAVQQRLAAAMWRWLRPGGAVIWYDFAFDNPRNHDVRGVPVSRVRALFPEGELDVRRVTLAPPLARAACRVHPALYPVLNAVPWLRTHRLAWIRKPG